MMKAHCALVVVALIGLAMTNPVQHEQGPAPDVDANVKMILVGMRHGNRNPGKYLKDDPNKGGKPDGVWGLEGDSELTNIGKRQAYASGVEIRNRYASLLPEMFLPKQVKAYSSSANRCQMTLQTFLAGSMQPTGKTDWKPELDWQPIPYTIDDKLLRMYAVSECTTSNEGWQPITDDNLPNLSEWIQRQKPLLDYIAQKTGWNASLSDAADVADNLMNIKMMGLQLPDWVEKSTLAGQEGKNLYDDILKFAEAHQIACADYRPCGLMMGGLWINSLLQFLNDKSTGKANDLKAVFYASHTEVTLSTMKLMDMDQPECPTSAGFILEYRDVPEKSVRLIFHEPDPANPDARKLFVSKMTKDCKGTAGHFDGGWCPLDDFVARVKPNSFNNWFQECKATPPKECPVQCPAPGK